MDQHDFGNLEIKRFLLEVITPNIEEYLSSRDSLRHALNACWSLDAFASYIFICARQHPGSKFNKEADFKNYLSNKCRSFKYVWDVSTATKHVQVTRNGKEIKQSSDVQPMAVKGWSAYFMQVPDTEWGTRIMTEGDAFALKALDEAVFQVFDFLRNEATVYSNTL